MLAIRLQRTGRKGHAQFRVVVQDSRRTPTSGNIVVSLGSFNPHTKQLVIDKEKASFYLKNGAQPSERIVRLLQSEKIALPAWVETPSKKEGKIKSPEKLRANRPAAPEAPAASEPVEPSSEDVVEAPVAEPETEAPAAEEPATEA